MLAGGWVSGKRMTEDSLSDLKPGLAARAFQSRKAVPRPAIWPRFVLGESCITFISTLVDRVEMDLECAKSWRIR